VYLTNVLTKVSTNASVSALRWCYVLRGCCIFLTELEWVGLGRRRLAFKSMYWRRYGFVDAEMDHCLTILTEL
jgi:hypothetical protein